MDRMILGRIIGCAGCGRSHTIRVRTARRPRLIGGVWHDYVFYCKRSRKIVALAIEHDGHLFVRQGE